MYKNNRLIFQIRKIFKNYITLYYSKKLNDIQ